MCAQLPREPRPGEPLLGAWGAEAIRYLRAITPRSSPTVSVSTLGGGTTYNAQGARGGGGLSRSAPFDIIIDPTGGALTATFRAGTINGLLPSNYLTGVDVPGSDTRYLCLNATAANGQITSASFTADAALPPAIEPRLGQPPAAFKILIGVAINGAPIKVWGDGNILAKPAESFRVDRAVATPGALPYEIYYTWEMHLI